jgi:hypothetical protein
MGIELVTRFKVGTFIFAAALVFLITNIIIDLIVITNNETRWNSTYLSIQRSLQLTTKIQVFSINYKDELKEDLLLPED